MSEVPSRTPPLGRFLLVELASDLARSRTTPTAALLSIRMVAGVKSVTDLAAISSETLDSLVLGPSEIVYLPEPETTQIGLFA